MKRFVCLINVFAIVLFISAQETKRVIDIQVPGSLSSQFTDEQKQIIEDLTVTGYVNKSDMSFINNLIKNYNLKVLDLGDVNLAVASYGENVIWNKFLSFGEAKTLQKMILPYVLDGVYVDPYARGIDTHIIISHIDTLVVGANLSVFDVETGTSYVNPSFLSYYAPHHLFLLDGVKVIPDFFFNFYQCDTLCFVTLSNKIRRIGGGSFCGSCRFKEPLVLPDSIEYLGRHPLWYDPYNFFYGDDRVNRWWLYSEQYNMPISQSRFDFPKQLKYYNSLGGSQNYVFARDVYSSDTIVVGEFCDTLYARIKAKIGIFYNKTPVIKYKWDDFEIDTLYVPENCRGIYESHYGGGTIGTKIKVLKEMISVKAINLFGSSHECYVDETLQLSANVLPEDAFDKRISWITTNPEIATVDNNGLVTAKRAGETEIVVKSLYTDSVEGRFHIKVLQHVQGLTLDINEATIWKGDTIHLHPILTPDDATNLTVSWVSTDESVAIVYDGIVKGKSAGNTTIKCISEDGNFSAQCDITVKQHVDFVELSKHELSLNVGDQEQFRVSVYPSNASEKILIWSSSNEDIALVDEHGKVSAFNPGIAWIKVESSDNNNARDSCLLSVIQPVEGIYLNYNNVILHEIGETLQLIATVLPENASNKEVKWSSSNESVCIVSNGTIVVVGYGAAVIIAKTVDGDFIATCVINVLDGPVIILGDVNCDGIFNIADVVE